LVQDIRRYSGPWTRSFDAGDRRGGTRFFVSEARLLE
jgi:hypothetical protein